MIFRVFDNDLFIYEFLRILCEKMCFYRSILLMISCEYFILDLR